MTTMATYSDSTFSLVGVESFFLFSNTTGDWHSDTKHIMKKNKNKNYIHNKLQNKKHKKEIRTAFETNKGTKHIN